MHKPAFQVREAQMTTPKRGYLGLAIKGFLALLVSVLSLVWAFQGVNLEELKTQLVGTSVWTVALFFVGQFVLHIIRVERWGLLVHPLAPISRKSVFSAASLGFSATFFLPLRLGEFVRPALLKRNNIPFAGTMASVVVERIADGLFNLGAFFLLLALLPAKTHIHADLQFYSRLAILIFGGAFVALMVMLAMRKQALRWTEAILSKISVSLSERVVGLLSAFMDGAMVLNTPGRLFGFIGLTLLYWVLNSGLTWFLALSYVDSLPFVAGLFSTSVVVFAIMIPAGPAFAGTLEAGFMFGMLPFGVPKATIAAIALVFHLVQLLFMAAIGGIGMFTSEVSITKAGLKDDAEAEAAPEAKV